MKVQLKGLIELARPHQYIKNGFVLVGPLFSHQWSFAVLSDALLAFGAFCLAASAVYFLNDLADIEADRAHPGKASRPLPSGRVSPRLVLWSVPLVAFAALGLGFAASAVVALVVSGYFLLNVVYSWYLKHVVILDVFAISAGFMLRILAGTLGLGIAPSSWLLLCGLMVTLFLGFGKRRAELGGVSPKQADEYTTRRVLDDYDPGLLDQFIVVTAACAIMSYGLYTVAPKTVELHGSNALIYTLPFVVYGIFRYLYLLHCHGAGNDTASDLLTDKHLLVTVGLWVAATLAVLS